jgi:hypothetical protein
MSEKRVDAVTTVTSDRDSDSDKSKPNLDDEKAAQVRERYYAKQAELQMLHGDDRPKNSLTSLWRQNQEPRNPDDIATQPSVFDDPDLAPYFAPNEKYENRHRFDPKFTWTWGEEQRLLRRIDWKIVAWACLGLFALDLHRKNISSANTDNFLDDLGLDTNDFNLGTTVFRTAFLLAELPSQLISKKLGP